MMKRSISQVNPERATLIANFLCRSVNILDQNLLCRVYHRYLEKEGNLLRNGFRDAINHYSSRPATDTEAQTRLYQRAEN